MDVHMSALSRARHQLETHGRFPGGALPEDITDSWLRSLSHGLDPLGQDQSLILTDSEFSLTRQSNAELIRFARPELELLYDQIAGSNFMVALGSADGVVLERLCDAQFAETGAGAQVVPGSIWTEDLRGTNAMGLCLATHRPAQVYGGEHFLRAHTDVSCLSAPIFNGLGGLAGVLDASSTSTVRQQHTAALVQMSATSIENSLICSVHEHLLVVQFHPRPEYLGTLSTGLLVLEEDGKIHAVNRRGEMFLTGFPQIRGQYFERIFEQNFSDIPTRLVQGETLRVRDRLGSAVSIRCVANRASFALARRSSVVPGVTEAAGRRALFRDVVIEDPVLWRRLSAMPEAVKRGTPIHISGESGTGKEMVARLCHAASGRSGNFVSLDGALVSSADMAQLCFEGQDGAPALIDQAAGGTLFLDDVTQISPEAQSLLVQVLVDKAYRRRGSAEIVPADVQIVSSALPASSSTLAGWEGIAPALRYRLEGFRIALPPLRERSDLAALAERFARSCRASMRIDAKALLRLAAHDWPGNLHELRSVITQAVLQSSEDILGFDDVDALLAPPKAQTPAAQHCCAACAGVPWKDQACRKIRAVVASFQGNVSQAARELGMSRTTVYKHLNRLE